MLKRAVTIRRLGLINYKEAWDLQEKIFKEQGLTKHDLGREKFLEEVWKWKEEYGGHILEQIKKEIRLSTVEWTFKHVYGHQDKKCKKKKINISFKGNFIR